ncbi:MAG: thiolase family protein [Ornithinimicrobium sp.]
MQTRQAHIIAAVRTPFGALRGGLSHIRTDDLAALPLRELMQRHPGLGDSGIDDVYLGTTNGAGEDNRNVARMAALLAGLGEQVPGLTFNRLCASGAETLIHASRAVAVADADLIVAGGVEGMSRAPYILPKPDEAIPQSMAMHQSAIGWRMVNPAMLRHWTVPLGLAAEQVAEDVGIGRSEQDEWAQRSHERAQAAYQRGVHDDFVMEVAGLAKDESIRPDSTLETLGGLRSAFSNAGAVTAGNASPLNDGALAAVVATSERAGQLGLPPLGHILGSRTVGVAPHRFTLGPVGAITGLLDRHGLGIDDIDLWEINEAFAAMVLGVLNELPAIDREQVNVNGGAIAMGHPLGASAPRVVIDLCRELRRRGGGLGVAAMCVGTGQGTAILVRVD